MPEDIGYYNIPDPPENIQATTVLIRMIDGLLFRYRWATEKLEPGDLNFKPCDSSMDMLQLLNHIHQLSNMIVSTFNGDAYQSIETISDVPELREVTMAKFKRSREILLDIASEDLENIKIQSKKYPKGYPFWNLINGPIADALTHVGQITSWRRINGNPVPKVNVFLGKGVVEH